MLKRWRARILASLIKLGVGPLLRWAMNMIDPIDLADKVGLSIKKRMEKVPDSTKKNIVLALEKFYLFAKEIYEDLRSE